MFAAWRVCCVPCALRAGVVKHVFNSSGLYRLGDERFNVMKEETRPQKHTHNHIHVLTDGLKGGMRNTLHEYGVQSFYEAI